MYGTPAFKGKVFKASVKLEFASEVIVNARITQFAFRNVFIIWDKWDKEDEDVKENNNMKIEEVEEILGST